MELAFDKLSITENTTRSMAHRLKAKENFEGDDTLHFCAFCAVACFSHSALRKHFKIKKHRASRNEVKADYQEAKAAKEANTNFSPNNIAMLDYNYKLALAKVTMLERFA